MDFSEIFDGSRAISLSNFPKVKKKDASILECRRELDPEQLHKNNTKRYETRRRDRAELIRASKATSEHAIVSISRSE